MIPGISKFLLCVIFAYTVAGITGPLADVTGCDNPENTCIVSQYCWNHKDLVDAGTLKPGDAPPSACVDGSQVTIPNVSECFAPSVMNTKFNTDFATSCPFLAAEGPEAKWCCNSDTASIMGKFTIK